MTETETGRRHHHHHGGGVAGTHLRQAIARARMRRRSAGPAANIHHPGAETT